MTSIWRQPPKQDQINAGWAPSPEHPSRPDAPARARSSLARRPFQRQAPPFAGGFGRALLRVWQVSCVIVRASVTASAGGVRKRSAVTETADGGALRGVSGGCSRATCAHRDRQCGQDHARRRAVAPPRLNYNPIACVTAKQHARESRRPRSPLHIRDAAGTALQFRQADQLLNVFLPYLTLLCCHPPRPNLRAPSWTTRRATCLLGPAFPKSAEIQFNYTFRRHP